MVLRGKLSGHTLTIISYQLKFPTITCANQRQTYSYHYYMPFADKCCVKDLAEALGRLPTGRKGLHVSRLVYNNCLKRNQTSRLIDQIVTCKLCHR